VPGPGYTAIPVRLNQDQFFGAYSQRALDPEFRAYSTAFEEWILRYPTRTGRASDQIVSFTVYALTDHSPAPGSNDPTNFRREVLFSGPR
jgi:hypothetical protein